MNTITTQQMIDSLPNVCSCPTRSYKEGTENNDPFLSIKLNPNFWEEKLQVYEGNFDEIDYNGNEKEVWEDIGEKVKGILATTSGSHDQFTTIIHIIKEEFEHYGVEFITETILCMGCQEETPLYEWEELDEHCGNCEKKIDHWGGVESEDEEDEHCNRCKTTLGNVDFEGLGVCEKCHIEVCG